MRPHNEIFTVSIVNAQDVYDLEDRVNRVIGSCRGSLSSVFTSESYIRMRCRMMSFVDGRGACTEPLVRTHTQGALSLVLEMDHCDCAVTARWNGGCTYPGAAHPGVPHSPWSWASRPGIESSKEPTAGGSSPRALVQQQPSARPLRACLPSIPPPGQ